MRRAVRRGGGRADNSVCENVIDHSQLYDRSDDPHVALKPAAGDPRAVLRVIACGALDITICTEKRDEHEAEDVIGICCDCCESLVHKISVFLFGYASQAHTRVARQGRL